MRDTFNYDVFISHSVKDKTAARELAKRLKHDGLKVTSSEKDLQVSRTLVLLLSKAAFASEWVTLERQTLMFRDPTNAKRRFIPVLIQKCTIPDIIAQFTVIDWLDRSEESYAKLVSACQPDENTVLQRVSAKEKVIKASMVLEGHHGVVTDVAVTPDRKRVVSSSDDRTLHVWDLESGQCLATFEGHTRNIWVVAVTPDGKRVGLQMIEKTGDSAKIKVYFEPEIPIDTQVSFIKYIHEHLQNKAKEVTRVRSYVCPHCNTPLKDRDAVRIRLERGFKDIICGICEERVTLMDLIEEKFASDEFLQAVREMDARAQLNLDNESRELILVGHAFTTAGEAGQIFRPTPNSDWGIDGEIEFKNKKGQASGKRVYLQLKSGNSYIYKRKDNKEIFTIKNPRHAEYWQSHEYPVMPVIRTSDGEIRWMNVSEYLIRHGKVKHVVFTGESFTALNISRLRDKVLGLV